MPASLQSLHAIDSRKRADQVRDRLVDLMRTGDFPAGQKLPTEPELMEAFGVGRSSIRAAVQSLVGLGILERRPGVGTFVRSLTLDDLRGLVHRTVLLDYGEALQLHEIRTMLETTGARLAAKRRTDTDLQEMALQIDRYRAAYLASERETSIDADLGFHRAIVLASKNPMLLSLLDSISVNLKAHRREYGPFSDKRELDEVISEHTKIYEAIRARDAVESERVIARHMRHVWYQIEELTNRSERAERSELFLFFDESGEDE
jgi:GntR family transcriptional repressor for pyruvate dehydrogenase complex